MKEAPELTSKASSGAAQRGRPAGADGGRPPGGRPHGAGPPRNLSEIIELTPLDDASLRELLYRALADEDGLKGAFTIKDEALDEIITLAGGDARAALTSLELASQMAAPEGDMDLALPEYPVSIERKSAAQLRHAAPRGLSQGPAPHEAGREVARDFVPFLASRKLRFACRVRSCRAQGSL